MKKRVEKSPKIALCRRCRGTGQVHSRQDGAALRCVCPQCGGSGRVLVSCVMELEIDRYTPED